MINELERMWKEAIVSYFKMLFLNVPESTGEIHEDHSQEN
jgi:hypothetical protein